MKRKIKAICLKDGKQIYWPTDEECKKVWDYVAVIQIEETYTIEEWQAKFVIIRSFDSESEARGNME